MCCMEGRKEELRGWSKAKVQCNDRATIAIAKAINGAGGLEERLCEVGGDGERTQNQKLLSLT